MSKLYRAVKPPLYAAFHLLTGLTPYGEKNVPEEGPLIVCTNHQKVWDPVKVGSAYSREVHFMAKKELFKNRIIGAILRSVNAFPISRGGSFNSRNQRTILNLLKEGHAISTFPEGTRTPSYEIEKLQRGAAWLALQAIDKGTPVLVSPTYLAENGGFYIGEPIDPSEIERRGDISAESQVLTDIISTEMEKLRQISIQAQHQ